MKQIKFVAAKLASIEIWVITACILVSIVFPSLLLVTVSIGVTYWLIRRFAAGRFSDRTEIDLSVLVLIALIPLNLWATAIPSKTLPQIYRLITGIIFFYAIINWARTSKRIRLAVFGVVLASVFLALFATISVEWNQTKLLLIPAAIYDRFVLLVSDSVHRNVMAGFLVVLYPITLGILLFSWRELHGWRRLALIIVACLVLGILVLTQSRGGLIALGMACLLIIILKWRWGWIMIPISIVLIGVAVAYLGVGRAVDILSSGVSLGGIDGRLEVWSRAIYMIQDFPFTGVGMGLFGDVADNLYPFFLNTAGSVPHAHNLFLQVAVDMGIPGLIAWLSILFIVVAASWRVYRLGVLRKDNWAAGLGAGLLCSQAALITHGFLDAAIWNNARPAAIIWGIWGLACAAWNYYQRRG